MTTGRLLVIGDIHGMFDELMLLLRHSGYDPAKDTLVALGDYIDRGPKSREVLEFLMDLRAKHGARVTLLKGNHEDLCLQANTGTKAVRAEAKLEWEYNGGLKTLESFGGIIPAVVISFMKKLPLCEETGQYIFVHAGTDHSLPMSEAQPHELLWNSSSEPHFSGKMVIVGHAIRNEVSFDAGTNTLYIDTGAFNAARGRTGRLSLVDLTNIKVHWINTGGPQNGKYGVKDLLIPPSVKT